MFFILVHVTFLAAEVCYLSQSSKSVLDQTSLSSFAEDSTKMRHCWTGPHSPHTV